MGSSSSDAAALARIGDTLFVLPAKLTAPIPVGDLPAVATVARSAAFFGEASAAVGGGFACQGRDQVWLMAFTARPDTGSRAVGPKKFIAVHGSFPFRFAFIAVLISSKCHG
jgi:hypothetical protein